MKINLKKRYWIPSLIFAVMYIVFLLLPLIVTPILQNNKELIVKAIKDSSGLDMSAQKLAFTTSWNLRAGIKILKPEITTPDDDYVVSADEIGANLEILPLFLKHIQLGKLYADNINLNLQVNQDGNFLITKYIPKNDSSEAFSLPFGLKLSNCMPDIIVKNYNVSLIDIDKNKKYSLSGKIFKVFDFTLDKRVKLSATGKVIFDGNTISNYDINIFNKIMPDLQLNDIIFKNENVLEDNEISSVASSNSTPFNIMAFLEGFVKNKFSADLTADVKTTGTLKKPEINGFINIDALSVGINGEKLPESYMNLKFKKTKTDIDSILFTSFDENEKTQIIGNFNPGKKTSVDLTFRSNAQFNNLITLINSIAKSFGYNELQTLSATGGIDADFNIKSDLKEVYSNGYLKILPSKIRYGLYNTEIDNIKADIDLDNGITINQAGFTILSHPFSIKGTISKNAETDLAILADKISVKGLLAALGQIDLLKENNISGGELSLNAILKGKLTSLNPRLSATLQNLKLYNYPTSTNFNLAKLLLNLNYDGKNIAGKISINDLIALVNGISTIKMPAMLVSVDGTDVQVNNSYILLNNSKINLSGGIDEYFSDKMAINFIADGNLKAKDIVSFLPSDFTSLISYKGSLPLNIKITGNSKIQNIKFEINADKDNYVSLIDIDLLKNKPSKLQSTIEIIGDSLTFSNTGLYEGNNVLLELSGGISKLFSNPKLNIDTVIPNQVSFPIWGLPNSNISAIGSVNISGKPEVPILKGKMMLSDLSVKDMDFSMTDLTIDLAGQILNGNATLKNIKLAGLEAKDISGKVSLKDYNRLNLTDISGKAFDGKVKGRLSYDINSAKLVLNFTGEGLNASNSIYGATGIKDALTGTLNFNAVLGMQGITDLDIIKSLNGNIDFNIDNGRFISIGKLENFVNAQNISSNSLLKSVISSLSVASVVQEADKFKTINGTIKLINGVANLSKITVSGPLMSYYVTGSYNIIPNTANLIILGRLENKVVSVLGVLGELSVEKLLSSIPKLGAMSASVWKQLTTDVASEDTSQIPALTNGSTTYRDFKVAYSGTVGAISSVKYFKWLTISPSSTTDINIKQDLTNAKNAAKENIQTKIDTAKKNSQVVKQNVNTLIEQQKAKAQTAKESAEQVKDSIKNSGEDAKQISENIKNILNNAIKNSISKPAVTAPSTDNIETENITTE